MQIFSNLLPLFSFFALLILHFAAAVLSSLARKIAKYVNIALHILFFFICMQFKIPLEEVALLYLVSLLCYLLAELFFAPRCRKKENEEKMREGGKNVV